MKLDVLYTNDVKHKVAVLYSAGIDSTVAAYYYLSKGYDVTLLIFDDGGINRPGDKFFRKDKPVEMGNLAEEFYHYAEFHKNFVAELHANPDEEVQRNKKLFGKLDWVELRYPQLNAICATHTKPVNEESADAESRGLDFWVGFKMLMGMTAQSYAAANGYRFVATGHMGYNSHYKDESPEAFERLNDLMQFCYGERLNIPPIIHPWKDFTKEKVISLGLSLGVPLEHTYSCRRGVRKPDGGYTHCGTCENCEERARAFSALNLSDESQLKS